jgi:hypothetical protein
MNKYTALLRKYLKIIFFLSMVLIMFVGFSHLFKASTTLQENTVSESAQYRIAFFKALQEHDLTKARVAYEKLKTLLPPEDQFLTEIGPMKMADLYLEYAQVLHYDPKSHDLMLAQARQLAPNHPKLIVMKPKLPEVPVDQTLSVDAQEIAEAPVAEPMMAPEVKQVVVSEMPAAKPLALHDQFPDLEERDGPPRIPFIDPPPLSPIQEPLTEEDLMGTPAAPTTQDPCALSFYSRTQPLTACIDPLGPNRYGPALFVVGSSGNQPTLAFTQAPVSHQEYDAYCDATKQCTDATSTQGSTIDLKDVVETVNDYNAYCQMTGTCSKIEQQNASRSREPLTKGQIQRYALWLSKETGYKYHHPTEQNVVAIQVYFQQCVNAKACPEGLLDSVGGLLSKPDLLLVREISS